MESYIPIFEGRLRLYHTEKNSGGGGYVPRNIGLSLAGGKYVYFMDADDFILLTGLETLYNAAEEHKAEVVYTSVYYDLKKPNTVYVHKDGLASKFRKEGIEDKTTLTIDDTEKLFYELLLPGSGSGEGNFPHPWSKFVRRDFLLKNEIIFPEVLTGGDGIWTILVQSYAKRVLRLTVPLYSYRRYSRSSASRKMIPNSEQLYCYASEIILFLEALNELLSNNKVLKKNPEWCYEAIKRGYFGDIVERTNEMRSQFSNQEIYETLYSEFGKRNVPSNLSIPFFLTLINAECKVGDERLRKINTLQKEVAQLKKLPFFPAISVVIPVYNAEEYIRECLDGLLAQTFQNFEVILVDDCSTDSGCEIIESYMTKFNGRLKLYHTEKNHGTGAVARSKGLSLSCGEYIYSMDNDDVLTKTALEELYTLAKEYDADVVYCEKYFMSTGIGEEFLKNVYLARRKIQRPPYVDKPTFMPENLSERVKEILNERIWTAPWCKLVRRSLIVDNNLFFPPLRISDDDIWTCGLVFYAKKFLRVPNKIYIRRMREDSITGVEKTPQEQIKFWLNPILLGLKSLDNIMNRHEFFKENPSARYAILKNFINQKFSAILRHAQELTEDEAYSTIKDEFGGKLGEYDVLIAALCATLHGNIKVRGDNTAVIRKFAPYFTARIDIEFISQTKSGDFQIFSVSDKGATVKKPKWFQKNGGGYVIQSYVGELKFVAKATTDGQVRLLLRGVDVRNSEDNSKRIPYWIDYTKLTINGKVIFDKLTPAWHDENFLHNINVKADEEVTVQVEWLPHRSDT